VGIEQCKPVELPAIEDLDGSLAFAEGGRHVPFPIARTFHVYDVPEGVVRGVHAHRTLEQAVFCVAGSMDITVDDGTESRTIVLDSPRTGLYLPPMVWHRLDGFSPGAVYVVLTSAQFDESDYIRDYDEYLAATGSAARI
jgi:dTDP-4-dehydrorhamnose 3,5-epimerase-like enzyme